MQKRPLQKWCQASACASSDRALHDFQARAAIERHRALAKIGAKVPRLELAEAHPARDRPGAGELTLLQIDGDVACRQAIAIGTNDPDRPVDRNLLRVD